MSAILSVDVGTTNWKATLFSPNGTFIDRRAVPTATRRNDAGFYYDPIEMWDSVCLIIRQLLAANRGIDVAAVGVTSIAESGVPLGSDGEPVYDSIAWFDPRSTDIAVEVEAQIGREKLFAITGLDPNPIFSLFKLLWLRRQEPERYNAMKTWIWIADYINYRLTGEIATDFSLASRTMMLDIHKGGWSDEILTRVSIEKSLLPPVVASGTTLGRITAEAGERTGLGVGIPVIVGGHDHHCAFLAAGALAQDVTLDSSGTVESIMRLLPKGASAPRTSKDIRVGYFVDPTRYATMAGVLGSGVAVDWGMRNVWMGAAADARITAEDYTAALTAVASVEPGEDIPFYVPHMRGAGAPYWDAQSRGAFVGLTSNHGRRELMRSIIEGLCFELRILLTAVANAFDYPPTSLLTVGGGAKNEVWQQIKADVTGLTVEIPDVHDGTARGAALIAAVGIGIYGDLTEASRAVFKVKKKFEPRREKTAYYDEIFEEYRQIYPSLKKISSRISERNTR